MIQLVFAHSGLAFGSHDGMPWPHISKDFQNFKMRTIETTLVMGAKTFASLPGLLRDRKHIVFCDLTRVLPVAKNGRQADNYLDINELHYYLAKWSRTTDKTKIYSVIGGASLLASALPYAERVVRTQISIPAERLSEVTTELSKEFAGQVANFGKLMESHMYVINGHTKITENINTL